MGSLKGQIAYALQSVQAPKQKRHEAKLAGVDYEHIFAYRSYRAHRDRLVPFVLFCEQQYHIRELYELRPAMVAAYVADMERRGLSSSYITNVLGSIRKLEMAMKSRGWRLAGGPLTVGLHAPGAGEHRYGYSPTEAADLVAHLVATADPRLARIVRLLDAAGLRLREAVQLRREDVDVDGGRVRVKGKGGKVRWAACADRALLVEILATAAGRFVFDPAPRTMRTIQETVTRARVDLGIETQAAPCHGFRGAFAEWFYAARLAEGQTDQAARQALAEQFGHKRARETYAYVPRQ